MDTRFILLTACKNEEKYIGKCIDSVVAQTCLPRRWLIVDDGSSDRTPSLVEEAAAAHPFIQLVRRPPGEIRNFGAQYRALNWGYDLVADEAHSFVGFLDADIALESAEYFAIILRLFASTPQLGIAGGYLLEPKGDKILPCPYNTPKTVPGGVQFFRRECFEKIQRFVPLHYGGSDTLANLMAEMQGYELEATPSARAIHYRPASSADGRIRGMFRAGIMDGAFGYDPMFMSLKCLGRLSETPVLVGSLARWIGYIYQAVVRRRSDVCPEVRAYVRRTQRKRLRALFRTSV